MQKCSCYFYFEVMHPMIRNLNQVSFQGFGNVPPERNQSAKLFEKNEAVSLQLSQKETVIYCAKSDTWVTFDSGISVLSVSRDGENYQHFYLDKPVCIKPGIRFAMSPFMGEATAFLYAKETPEQIGMKTGMLVCALFPLLGTLLLLFIIRFFKKEAPATES